MATTIQHERLESEIEKYVVDYACSRGIISRKMNGIGYRAWPDRLFIGPHLPELWIEFKRKNEEPRPDQRHVIKQLTKMGRLVTVVDNPEDGCAVINAWMAGACTFPSPRLFKRLRDRRGRLA